MTEVENGSGGVVNARDAIRAQVFAAKKLKTKEVVFFGTTIELRQSTLGQVLASQQEDDRKTAIVRALLSVSYVPKTDERLFDETDEEGLLSLPFGADFMRVNDALTELTEVNFLDKKPSSEDPPSE